MHGRTYVSTYLRTYVTYVHKIYVRDVNVRTYVLTYVRMYVSGRLWMYMYAENQDATCKKFREKGLGPLGQKLAAPCSLYIADLQVLQVLLGK